MTTQFQTQNLLPIQQPFQTAPWQYTGTESTATPPPEAIDWVLIMTRDAAGTILHQAAGFISATGELLNTDGTLGIPIKDALNNYISIHPRGHLAVLSAQPYTGELYDFTISDTTVKGLGQLKQIADKYLLHAGDYDASGIINSTDFNNWKVQGAVINQYLPIDGDGNGIVNNKDYNLWIQNRSKVGAPSIRY